MSWTGPEHLAHAVRLVEQAQEELAAAVRAQDHLRRGTELLAQAAAAMRASAQSVPHDWVDRLQIARNGIQEWNAILGDLHVALKTALKVRS